MRLFYPGADTYKAGTHKGYTMRTTKSLVYGAREQAIDLPVPLTALAISPSIEDLAFLGDRFEEATGSSTLRIPTERR
jgi:hypothetical protein